MRKYHTALFVLLNLCCSPLSMLTAHAGEKRDFPYSNEVRDLFFYQCIVPHEPRLKSMTLMFVGDKTISTIIVQDNDFPSAGGTMELRNGQWEAVDEGPIGTVDRLKTHVYKIDFKLITAAQYKKLFRTTPSEKCK